MRRLISALSIILLVAACPPLFAQATISGRVVDKDNQPISHVTVQSSAIRQTVQTDADGKFTIRTTSTGPVSLTFSHAGYIPRSIKAEPGGEPVTVSLATQVYPMQGVTVTAGRAVDRMSPVSFSNVDSATIARDFDIGEVPTFLEITPNLYAYSDAGGGLGYSYLKIRGFDARRAPVYINGVPLNDPEDHALYFVDLPDFAENADNIQVQRGAGNALYGDASFAGSINILTSGLSLSRKFQTEFGYGGFLHDGSETVGIMRKSSVGYSSGLINGVWSLSGRWVKQFSEGYRENSWYDGTAYYLTVGRIDPKSISWLDVYGGPMSTHAAWWGIPRDLEYADRRYNYYTYDNETDNFTQPHFELHNIYNLTDNITLNTTAYFIKGKGYYEQYRYGEQLSDYNLTNDTTTSDLARRKWVNKYQIGLTNQTVWKGKNHTTSVGGSYYFFQSHHWGEVIWAEALSPSLLNIDDPSRYYEYFGKYQDFSVFGSHSQKINDRLTLTGDLQLRYLRKDIHTTPIGQQPTTIYGIDWLFLSPRIGLNYNVTENLTPYVGFSIASHEPNDEMIDEADNPYDRIRLEIIDSTVTPWVYGDPTIGAERVYDVELGTDYRSSDLSFDFNLFWMDYRNEIVPDGGVNDDGFPTYGNADRSVHRGIELSAAFSPVKNLKVDGNYAFNDNWIRKYNRYVEGDGSGVVMQQLRDVPVPGFPTFLANLALDYTYGPARFVYRIRGVGRQFVSYSGQFAEIGDKLVDVSIAPYTVSSIKGIFDLGSVFGGADISVEGRVDNLFNRKYETFGAYSYGEYYYWPAAERNWFINFKMTI
jgi:iron complex outermembrane receptor protein